MARDLRRERVDSQCPADCTRTALQGFRQRGVRGDAALGYLLEGSVDAFLVFGDDLFLRHGDRCVGVWLMTREDDMDVVLVVVSLSRSHVDAFELTVHRRLHACPCTLSEVITERPTAATRMSSCVTHEHMAPTEYHAVLWSVPLLGHEVFLTCQTIFAGIVTSS
jgi:hypothetical protein